MSRYAALSGLLAVLALVACGSDLGDPHDLRAARIEQQLLASCSCHPKKIAGLPLEAALRADIRAGLGEGLDDDAILWRMLERYGGALLEAGLGDVTVRAQAAAATTVVILLLAAGTLLLQLRR